MQITEQRLERLEKHGVFDSVVARDIYVANAKGDSCLLGLYG